MKKYSKLAVLYLLYDLYWTKGVNAQGATMRATSDKIVACRVASNYPFAKLMEIAESVPTGRVRQATKFFNRQATILSLVARVSHQTILSQN